MKHQVLMLLAMYSSFLLSMDHVSCTLDTFGKAKTKVAFVEKLNFDVKKGRFDFLTKLDLKGLDLDQFEELQQRCKKYIKAIGFIQEMHENTAIAQHFESLKVELQKIAKTDFPENMLDIDMLKRKEKDQDLDRARAFTILSRWRYDFDEEKQLDILQKNVSQFILDEKTVYIIKLQEQAVAFQNKLKTIKKEVWEKRIIDYCDTRDGSPGAPTYDYVRRTIQ